MEQRAAPTTLGTRGRPACRDELALLFLVHEEHPHSVLKAGRRVEASWPHHTGREDAEERSSGIGLKSNNPNLTRAR